MSSDAEITCCTLGVTVAFIYRVISSTFTLRRSIAAILTLQPSQQVETP
ncbi:MAG: hypothetical protein V7K95_13285 [Nostoc sp.]